MCVHRFYAFSKIFTCPSVDMQLSNTPNRANCSLPQVCFPSSILSLFLDTVECPSALSSCYSFTEPLNGLGTLETITVASMGAYCEQLMQTQYLGCGVCNSDTVCLTDSSDMCTECKQDLCNRHPALRLWWLYITAVFLLLKYS